MITVSQLKGEFSHGEEEEEKKPERIPTHTKNTQTYTHH